MKRRILALLLAAATLLSLTVTGFAADEPIVPTIYVAVTGNDSNDGSAANPVATLQRAADLAKEKTNGGTKAVTVSVGAGKYFMASPLTLDASHSNIHFAAQGDVILTGAKTLANPKWTTENGLQVTTLDTGLAIDQLFINGEQQILARYPNYNAAQALQGCTSAANIKARSAGWNDPTGGYIRALHNNKWGGNSYRITGKNNSNLGLAYTWVGDNNRGSGLDSTSVMVENIREELDAEKEWFYDRGTGKLYVKPAANVSLDGATVECAVTEELIHIAGTQDGAQAKDITFDGLTLENTARTMFTRTYIQLMRGDWCVVRSGALYMENAEGIRFENGVIRNIGGNAVFMSGHNANNVIHNNTIENIGSSGVLIAGLPDSCREASFWEYTAPLVPETSEKYVHKKTIEDTTPGPAKEHYPKDCTVSNNHIKNVGIWEKQSSQVAISVASGIKVLHNTINVGPRAGINVNDGTFGGHEIAYNDVFDVQKETHDHGMFNSWGRDRFWSLGGYDTGGNRGTEKEPYSLIDCVTPILIHDNRMHFGGRVDGGTTFGIDLDDGSSNYKIYNNLCLNMGIKLREGFHREVYNNIVVNGQINLHCTFANSYDKIHGNIVVKGTPYALAATDQNRFAASQDVIEKNWFYDLGMAVSFPGYWDALGYNKDSILGTADPGFQDAANNDYTVTNTEMMEKIGFTNFDMDQFGQPGCADVCPLYEKTEPDSNVDVLQREEWLGATISALDDAIMTATSVKDLNGVYMETVPADSAAAGYGLKTNDVIRAINGVSIGAKSTFIPMYNKIDVGQIVYLTVHRNGHEETISFIKGVSDSEGTYVDDRDAQVQYTGDKWEYADQNKNPSNAVNCYNKTITYKNLSGIDQAQWENYAASLAFSGDRIVLYGRTKNDMGDYRIVITDKSGEKVVNTTASAFANSSQQKDQQVIYDSDKALTYGEYTIRVTSESSQYIILDAFCVYGTKYDDLLSILTGPVQAEAGGTRADALVSGQTLTLTVPVKNTGAQAVTLDVTAALLYGAETVKLETKPVTAAAGATGNAAFTIALPEGSEEMRLLVMVSDHETGHPVAGSFRLAGANAGAEDEPAMAAPDDGEIIVAYAGKTGLATVAARNAGAAGRQVILTVWEDDTLVAQRQSTAGGDGTARFALTLLPEEATAYRFRVCAEGVTALEQTQTLEQGASVVDKSALQQAIREAKAILEDTAKMYTPDTMEAFRSAYTTAVQLNDSQNAEQADIQAAIDALHETTAALRQMIVTGTYTPKAAEKGTYFELYDAKGNVDGGNRDGQNGDWQARPAQVDATAAGAYLELHGYFTSLELKGANKYDSANFRVEIVDHVTDERTEEAITQTKNQSGTVTIYSKTGMSGNYQTVRVYNNENGNYLEIRGIVCTTGAVPVAKIEVLKGDEVINGQAIKVYTNDSDPNHSVTLTTRVTPEDAADKTLDITRKEGAEGKIELVRPGDGTATITAIPGEENVGEVTIEVASVKNPDAKATFTVQVIRKLENPVSISIQGVNDPSAAPRFGQTLEADINQLKMTDNGKAALRYQWKRGGTAIPGATDKTYTLTEEDIGATISVDVIADEDTFYEGTRSATRDQTVVKADGPAIPGSTIYGVKATTAENNDGKITGFGTDFAKYEYTATGDENWTAVEDAEVTGLASGEYQVRIKETDTHEAGAAINVTVPAYNADFHMINIDPDMENGTVTRSVGQAGEGTTITLTIAPDTGYELDTITVTGVTLSGTGNTRTFTMPNEDVTVSATFKKIKLTVTHVLTNLTCSKSAAGDHHEVEYGDTAAITLVPDEGYQLPAGADITIVNGNGDEITGWTIDQGGTITITGGVTSDLTITAAGVRKTCTVNYTVTNGVTAEGAPRSVAYGEAYSATLRVTSGYSLPKSVTMTLDGAAFTDFTYDSATGAISIAAGKLTGKLLVITASGSASGSSGDSGSGSPSRPSQPSKPVETEKPAPSGSTEVKAPTTNVDEKGEAQTSVSTSQMSGAITEAAKENKAEVVIAPDVTGDASKVSVEVPKSSVGQMANQTEAALTVKTDIADVKLPNASLEDLTNRSGSIVTVSVETAENGIEIAVKVGDVSVTKLSGGVVAKVPAQSGNVLVVVNADGSETIVKKSIVHGDTVAGLVDGSCTVKIVENNKTFADTANHWAKDAVEFAASRELFSGTAKNTFSPNVPMNRAMLATVLYRLEDAAASGKSDFHDVPDGTWYTDAVTWASQKGIVSGTGNGFAPNNNVTREQLASMLYRYAKTLGMDTAVRGSLSGFADSGKTSGWAQDAMTWAVGNGLITGKGGGRLDPTGTATRAEVAAILQRMVAQMVK